MAQLPTIYTIQASGARQHGGKLEEILQTLKEEHRIADYSTLGPDVSLAKLKEQLKANDMVLMLLTQELEPQKEPLENKLDDLTTAQPDIKVAEIIVDKVVYDNKFITFPADLRPIRDREDMDAVWDSIEQSLKDMFPAEKKEEPVAPTPTDWSKYLKIAGVIIALLVAFFVIRGFMGGDDGKVEVAVPADSVEASPVDPTDEEASTGNEASASLSNEDCLPFNYNNLNVQTVRDHRGESTETSYRITDGNSRMMLFRTKAKANMAVRIIRNYQFETRCFAVRPDPELSYFKVNGDIPSGNFPGEDCIRINNPQNLTIRQSSNTLFQILDGNHIPFAAKSRKEAERIVEVVKHYKARFTCYVERPNPGMVYLKK